MKLLLLHFILPNTFILVQPKHVESSDTVKSCILGSWSICSVWWWSLNLMGMSYKIKENANQGAFLVRLNDLGVSK